MKSLGRYAVANAVTRTMFSELLSREEMSTLAHAGSLEEAWTALGRTSYGDYIHHDVKVNELAIEKVLREVTAGRFRRAIRHLRDKPAEVGKLLLSRWELDNLEFALRLWHGRDASLDEYLTNPSFVYNIPVYQITAAESIDEVALALRDTPYLGPVAAAAPVYKTKGSIFYVEMALETDYYRRLLAAIKDLGGKDASDGERLVASEIDLLNLSMLARLVKYYDVTEAEVHHYMIPGPSAISRRLSTPGDAGHAFNEITAGLLEGRGALEGQASGEGKVTLNLERLSLLEHMVAEMGVNLARGLLAGYPFRITSTIAFYILSRLELRNLSTVFVGKAGGMSETDILRRLSGLG
jgi:vacuolar-type H+-ATPase subunit C/Vma6